MRKLLAIMLTLVMCCSLVVSASAANTYSGTGFDIVIDIDGEWEDLGNDSYQFTVEDGTVLVISVLKEADISNGMTTEELYEYLLETANDAYAETAEGEGELAEGEISGYPAFIMEELYEDESLAAIYICSDNYIFEIEMAGNGDDETYNALADSVLNISISDGVVDETPVVDSEEEDTTDDNAADDDAEEPEEDTEAEEDDKEEADSDEEDGKKDNTTLIIIIVAVVAVVAIAAVVIVLVTKKKK